MAKSNLRIIKKLSVKAAKYLPNVDWDTECQDPHCEWWSSVPRKTPIVWYRCSNEYDEHQTRCAWAALRMVFINERDATIYGDDEDWLWGNEPTPANVFYWAYWNEEKLIAITERSFSY